MKKLKLLFLLLISLTAYQTYLGQNTLINYCSTGLGTNVYAPMNSSTTANSKNRLAFILPASQLTVLNGGSITSTYFRRLATSGSLPAGTNFKIYLKLTTATDFGATSPDWATEIATATAVYDSDPATAVGSTAGFKQFLQTASFVYTAGSSLAVYVEYTQTTAPTTAVTWDYEYGGSCVISTNNYTTKYVTTSVALPATLTTSNYRRPVIAFDVTFPPAASAPACTTLSAPASSATAVSVTPTFTWSQVGGQNGATSYLMNLGTTAGGTDVMNGVDLGNVTTYTIPAGTPLNFSTKYYVTVIPKNSIGNATGCTESNFTTGTIACPAVTAPAAAATGLSTTPTITWTATAGATGYKLSVGTTAGGTDVLNAQDLGNVTTYTFPTALNTATKYYYTLNSYVGSATSASCTERNFTTLCGAYTTLPWSENFDSLSTLGAGILPICWSNITGSKAWTSMNATTTAYNVPKSTPNYVTIAYSNTVASQLWTPGFVLTAGTSYDFSFYYNTGGTSSSYIGYTGNVLTNSSISTTGATDLGSFITATQGTTAGVTGYLKVTKTFVPTSSGTYYFGLNVSSTSSPWYLGVDDFKLEITPSCFEPTFLTSSAVTTNTATIGWTAPAPAPANGYEYYYSTTNTAPTGSGTATTSLSVNLSLLSPATTYYYWVRSICSGTSSSTWASSSFNTAPTNDDCSAPIVLTVGATFAQNAVIGTNLGATSTTDASAVHGCQTTASKDVWYSVVVPASGSLTIESAAVTGSPITDTVMGVYSGSCGSLTSLGCSDDILAGTNNFSKVALTSQTPGATLLVGLWNYSPTTTGQFKISAYDASLATTEVSTKEKSVTIYPNPFKDILNISDVKDVTSVVISDISGRTVKTIAKPTSELNLSDLNTGLYLVTLKYKDGSVKTMKAIKK